MKRLSLALAVVIVSLISFHCQKELSGGGGTGTPPNTNNPSPITAHLQGNIVDENDQPASGVVVHVGAKTATTNNKGYFRIPNASLDKNASLVIAEKTGYFKAYRTFSATSGTNQVVIKLVKRQLSGTVSATTGGDVILSNGSKITLPANGIVTAAGSTAYTGVVSVYAAYIDPTAPDISKTIPGSLIANDKNGNTVTLSSYGMLAVELQSASGEKLQIASGSTATLTTAIPASRQSSAPATIPMWYVDEQTGIWKEEGTATKSGTNYIGQVKHFSFWNCDYYFPSVSLTVKLVSAEGLPLVNMLVKLTKTDTSTYGSTSGYGWTDSLGQVSGLVPANSPLLMEVLNPCWTSVYSQNVAPSNSNINLGTITVTNSTSFVTTFKGKLLDCSNAPVTNGYAIVYYNNTVRYAATDNNGNFATTFLACSNSPTTCDVLGVDNAAQQQGTLTTVTITNPTTNAGSISACGNSALQFINYTLDGTDYVISSAVNDSLTAYSYPMNSQPTNLNWFSGWHPTSSNINFAFTGNTTGTSPLLSLTVQNLTARSNGLGINVNVTSYPVNPGEFYAGSFSGQFTDSLGTTTHNINCTFKVRK